MKMAVTEHSERKTNAPNFQSQSFSIGDASMIIEILRSKLYSNPIQTLVQEYISNARDANREAKAARPIKISVPTDNDLTLHIRDYGPGLTPERVQTVFCRYGKSTKRDSNTQVGGFGIGAKSAWAYTDSFTVITYVDGVAYHYVAHISKSHAGSLDLISQLETTEPNGTEIQVVARREDLEKFRQAVVRCVQYWKTEEFPEVSGMMLDQPNVIFESENFQVVPGKNECLVVVDGIPYPMPLGISFGFLTRFTGLVKNTALFHFATGEIEVAASREAVTTTEENRNIVTVRAQKAVTEIETYISSTITKTETVVEALQAINVLKKHFNSSDSYPHTIDEDTFHFTFGGKITSDLYSGLEAFECSMKTRRGIVSENMRTEKIGLNYVNFIDAVVYYTDGLFSQAKRTRMIKPLTSSSRSVYLISGDPDSDNLKKLARHLKMLPLSSLDQKTSRPSLKREKNEILINVINGKSQSTKAKVIDPSKVESLHVYSVGPREKQRTIYETLLSLGITYCFVTEQTALKLSGHSNWVQFEEFVANVKQYVPASVYSRIVEDMKPASYSGNVAHIDIIEILKNIDQDKIADRFFVEQLRKVSGGSEKSVGYYAPILTETWVKLPEVTEYRITLTGLTEYLNKYPLLTRASSYYLEEVKDEVLWYLNAKYREAQNGN